MIYKQSMLFLNTVLVVILCFLGKSASAKAEICPIYLNTLVDQANSVRGQNNMIALSPDGTMLAVASNTGLFVYDTNTFQLVHQLDEQSHTIAWSPDGLQIASASFGERWGINIFNVRTDEAERQLLEAGDEPVDINGEQSGSPNHAYALAWSPDGVYLAAIGSSPFRVWNIESDTLVLEQAINLDVFSIYIPMPDLLAWSPSGHYLSVGGTGDLRIWETSRRQEFSLIPANMQVYGTEWLSDERLIAVGLGGLGDEVAIWQIGDQEPISTWEDTSGAIISVDLSPDGTKFALGGAGNRVQIVDAETGEELRLLRHTDWVYAVEWMPDNVRLISMEYDGTIYLWDTDTGCVLNSIASPRFATSNTP